MSATPDIDRPDLPPLPVVRRELLLAADRDAVWAQLADADGLAGWLADEVDLDVRPGAEGTVRDDGGPERPVRVEDVEPGRRLALVWRDVADEETLVDLALEDVDPAHGDVDPALEDVPGGAPGIPQDPSRSADDPDGGRAAVRTRLVVVEIPMHTLSLVAPAADRVLAEGAGDAGRGRGGGAASASAVLAGCR